MKMKSNLSSSLLEFMVLTVIVTCVNCTKSTEKSFNDDGDDEVARDVLKVFGKPKKDPSFDGCETASYPPPKAISPDEYIINLDLPPEYRWAKLASEKTIYIQDMLNNLRNYTDFLFRGRLFNYVDELLPILGATLPYPFREEIQGMSELTGIPYGEMILYNIFYELFTVCTSIIAQNSNGTLYHVRNLDFGLFLGWDIKNETWMTTEYLKPLVVKLKFQRGNKTVFESVNFAGYIGILTGLKPAAFTLTINERFTLEGGFLGIIEWMLGNQNPKWLGFLTREVMENATSYKMAQKMLLKTSLLAPAYYILGGVRPGQGCVITRGQKKVDLWPLGQPSLSQNSSWYLVQTNYDNWKKAPLWDDRRKPAVTCMDGVGSHNVNFKTLYNVLSTRPVLNKLTTYTALMQVNGSMEIYLRECESPCWPW